MNLQLVARAKRLYAPTAIPGWFLAFWGFAGAVGKAERIYGWIVDLTEIISTPTGGNLTLTLGFVWLGVLVWRPWAPKKTNKLAKLGPADIDYLIKQARQLRQHYNHAVCGDGKRRIGRKVHQSVGLAMG